MPKPKHIYVINPGGTAIAFVPHPVEPARWLRTDRSVVLVDCSYCRVPAGSPCRRDDGNYTNQTHWVRRRDAKGLKIDLTHNQVLVVSKGGA